MHVCVCVCVCVRARVCVSYLYIVCTYYTHIRIQHVPTGVLAYVRCV